MDSLRGIPVEHKLETFSMPSTGTTSCHPKNWLCRFERNMEISQTLSKLHGNFEHIPHKSNNMLPSQQPAKPFRLKHPTSLNTTSLAASKSKPYSMLQIKNFHCCVVKAKFRNSFVCLKKYSVRGNNKFPETAITLCSLQAVVLIHQHYLPCWQVLFLLLFLVHTVCQRHCWVVSPNESSWVFFQYLFSLPSFICTVWFISLSCTVCFTCWVAFFFVPKCSSVLPLS